MQKILVSLPDNLVARMKAVIPNRFRSKLVTELLEIEIKKREDELYSCACAVEADEGLNVEMEHWDVTIGDGIESESW